MRPDTLVAFIVFGVGMVVLTALIPRVWSNDLKGLDSPRPWWMFGGETWRAFVRITPIALVGGWLLIAAGVLMLTTPAGQRTPLGPAVGRCAAHRLRPHRHDLVLESAKVLGAAAPAP